MRRHGLHGTVSALAFVLLPVAAVQSQGTIGNTGTSGTETIASSDEVVVTINGHAIAHAEIDHIPPGSNRRPLPAIDLGEQVGW